jgi:hypothetical protein
VLQHKGIYSPSPLEYSKDIQDHKELYKAELAEGGVTLNSISVPQELTPGNPSFTESPSVTSQTENSLTVEFLANIDGGKVV